MTTIVSPGDELPRTGPGRRRAEIACVTGIVVKSVVALVLLPLTPSLLGTNPVLLEALRGSTSAMASGGAFARVGQASLLLAVLAPLPTLLFVTPFFWWAGRLWGPQVAATLSGGHPSAEKWARRSGAHLERLGGLAVGLAPFLPVPSSFIYAAAGWTGMSLRRFMIFDVLGMLAWVGLIVGLGYAVGHPAVQLAKAISHYALLFTIALVAVAFVIGVVRARRAAARGDHPEAMTRDAAGSDDPAAVLALGVREFPLGSLEDAGAVLVGLLIGADALDALLVTLGEHCLHLGRGQLVVAGPWLITPEAGHPVEDGAAILIAFARRNRSWRDRSARDPTAWR